MEVSRAIDLIDDKMCWGRGTFSAHHMPEYDEYWQAGEMAIDALKKQEEGRWHSVAKEGNPKKSDGYLVSSNDKIVFVLYYSLEHGWDGWWNDRVTAWRPLPEAFQEEK